MKDVPCNATSVNFWYTHTRKSLLKILNRNMIKETF